MRIAFVQSDIEFESKERNIEAALGYIKKAAERSAELILFPEMSFTGFSMNTALIGETDFYTVDLMRGAAKEHGIAVGFGYVRLHGGKAENRYVIVGSDGRLLSDYVKLHSFVYGGECDDFRSGDALPAAVPIGAHSLTTFICYDLRFPEIFRAVCDKSSIITVAANWPASRIEHWRILLRARAIENQVYVIGINCVGTQDGLVYSGGSMAVSPSGEIIADAGAEEGMPVCDIENDVAVIREEFPVLKSRKNIIGHL